MGPLFEGFTAETGIKINFIGPPDEDTMFAQCRLSLETGGIDCVEPSVARMPVSYARFANLTNTAK